MRRDRHATCRPGDEPLTPIQRQREEDGALYFDLWGGPDIVRPSECPADANGAAAWRGAWQDGRLWLWPELAVRAIAIRPLGGPMIDQVARLGGVRQRRDRYDLSVDRDWHVPVARWREVREAVPALARLRARALARETLINAMHYAPQHAVLDGAPAILCFTPPSRGFADEARGLGARFAGRLAVDRPGWWIAADAEGAPAFVALAERYGRARSRLAARAVLPGALRLLASVARRP